MALRAGIEREKSLDYRAGLQVATLINVQPRKKGASRRVYEPHDFFPWLRPAPRVQSPNQQRNALLALATVSGARIVHVSTEELRAMASGN